MASTTSISNSHYYYSNSEINFFKDDQDQLSVTIDTDRLHIRSVESTESDYEHYAALFGDKKVMEKFANGEPKTKDEMRVRINDIWVKRWHNKDPYSGLAVFKSDTDDFLGHVVLGHGDTPGESELAYLFNHNYWGKRYGTETVTTIVKEYAPATVKEGYILEGEPLKKIVATTRPDNLPSIRILQKVGMHLDKVEEKYGNLRLNYSVTLNPPLKSS